MSDAVIRIAEAMKRRAATEVSGMIAEGLSGVGLVANPAPDDGPFVDDNEDTDQEDTPSETSEEYVDGISLAFEDDDAKANLQAAASAYRIIGGRDLLIAQHEKSKRAFFGTDEELE
jgi:hypothetical protein